MVANNTILQFEVLDIQGYSMSQLNNLDDNLADCDSFTSIFQQFDSCICIHPML
jgi:hypothetical protein